MKTYFNYIVGKKKKLKTYEDSSESEQEMPILERFVLKFEHREHC